VEITPEEQQKKRLFFALDLNQLDKQTISAWCQQHVQENVKTIKASNFHITLAFLGYVSLSQEQKLTEQATLHYQSLTLPIADRALTINQLGLFNKPQVAYLGFSSFPQQLLTLAESLSNQAKSIELFQENRPYLPHISIFRKVKTLGQRTPFQIDITIESFSLYHSTSVNGQLTYLPLKTWLIK
jgi:2'-5' RNA ligase